MTQVQPSSTPRLDAAIAMIESMFLVIPTAFRVGSHFNREGSNLKSLAILAYAKWHLYSVEETLRLFGEAYEAVLADPEGRDHLNVRALMKCMDLNQDVDFGHLATPLKAISRPKPATTAPTNEQLRHPVHRRNNLLRG